MIINALILGEKFNEYKDHTLLNLNLLWICSPEEIFSKIGLDAVEFVITNFNDGEQADWNKAIQFVVNKNKNASIISYEDFFYFFQTKNTSFSTINIQRIVKHNIIPCDIFLEMTDDKMIKIINANQLYSLEMIQKLIQRGVKWLCVRDQDFKDLLEFLYHKIHPIQGSNKTEPEITINNFYIQAEKVTLIKEFVAHFSIDRELIHKVDNINNECIALIQKEPDLLSLFKQLNQSENYISMHSLFTSYLSSFVAYKMNWSTDQTLYKLSFASLLHDMALTDEKYAEVHTLEEAEKYSYQEFLVIRNHPVVMAEKAGKIKEIPADVVSTILSHHELPDGNGFPRKLTASNISQISALFNICHDFVNRIYQKEITSDLLKNIQMQFQNTYDQGNYKYPLRGMVKFLDDLIV